MNPSTSKYARRSTPDTHAQGRPTSGPTIALPGTKEKIEVMEARAARHEVLFHPMDATFDSVPRQTAERPCTEPELRGAA